MTSHGNARLGDLNGRWTLVFKAASLMIPLVLALSAATLSMAYDYGQRIRALESWKDTIVPERTRYQEQQTEILRHLQADVSELRIRLNQIADKTP